MFDLNNQFVNGNCFILFFKIKVILTESAKHFINFCQEVEIYTDVDEWAAWSKRGDPVLHIDLGKWADIFLIAPLDANTLAKLSNVN